MAKITIIMATFNAQRYLDQAIQSIRSQEYEDLELIIIDGQSKDKTIDIVKKNSDIVKTWISEPDKGIYDAWNKGIRKAKGEWIMFLGSDDLLLPGALKTYSDFITSMPQDIEYVSAKAKMADADLNEVRVRGWPWEWPRFLKEMTVAHPGSLHARSLFETYGYFNVDYRIVGDYELLLRPKSELKAAYLDVITVVMREGGASDSWAAIREHYRASTQTGDFAPLPATANMLLCGSKFYTKKLLRSVGVNMYLRK